MKQTNKKFLEELIRVDHAGERGAIKIYEGQLLALKTFKQDENLKHDTSTSALLQEFENNKSKSCKTVDFRVFGLSLATINLFISLILSIITFKKILKK